MQDPISIDTFSILQKNSKIFHISSKNTGNSSSSSSSSRSSSSSVNYTTSHEMLLKILKTMILYTVHSVYNLNGKCKEKKNAFHLPNFENKDAKLCFFLAI